MIDIKADTSKFTKGIIDVKDCVALWKSTQGMRNRGSAMAAQVSIAALAQAVAELENDQRYARQVQEWLEGPEAPVMPPEYRTYLLSVCQETVALCQDVINYLRNPPVAKGVYFQP